MAQRNKVVVIGAAGAVGKQLVAALVKKHGPGSVVAALHRSALPKDLAGTVVSEFEVDIRNRGSLEGLFAKHGPQVRAVWNLAAPLSVETARNPELAEEVTVGGMKSLLAAMSAAGLPPTTRVCFSDSIGSFGGSAPRDNVPASWLVSHPDQDPGSDYGRQKRGCRELLKDSPFDTRWAVIPGVLHTDAAWGAGTTEYALEAMAAAARREPYQCPVAPDEALPMIFAPDLIAGLVALTDAPREALRQPQAGYAIAGFSFTPKELFAALRARFPDFTATFKPDGAASKFAELWPNSLSAAEAAADLGYTAKSGLEPTLDAILAAHAQRQASTGPPALTR